ncbi:TetR/AcrR family transcriptional regulator [Nocardia sp. NPDC057353]|uniref:TetR/AcrR family transcriptional regulator n=1 Tax=Nocardia sp. NPDC057353 TaxID=3346104 RepID=UPI0036420136
MASSVTRGRRTQHERSSAMRERLLDATVDCLVEYGYAGTTTPRIAARAGVTRGAQVHHFGAKADLVVAAVRHLAQRRSEVAVRELDRATTSADPLGVALELLWETHQGPLFAASAELWIAGRTDPVLAAALREAEPVIDEMVLATIAHLLPADRDARPLRDLLYTAMDVLRGILVADFVGTDPGRARRRWLRAVTELRRTLPEQPPGAPR